MAKTRWPNYEHHGSDYDRCSSKFQEALYRLCREMPTHEREDEVWAKVFIIGRTYVTGLERRLPAGLQPIVEVLVGSRAWIDRELRALQKLQKHTDHEPSHDRLPRIARLHGRVVSVLATETRSGHRARSFVAKYLHFHAPVVPLYDSIVAKQLRAAGWHRWTREMSEADPCPEDADEQYWRHCVRTGRVVDDWRQEGLEPTARNIDAFEYAWATAG